MKVTQIVLLSALLAIVLAGGCAGVANAQSLDLPAEDEKEKGVLAAYGKESAPAPPPKPHGNSSSKHHGNSSSKHHPDGTVMNGLGVVHGVLGLTVALAAVTVF
ncbi:uncharacterized protein Tco025E_00474 [Trypanosoma conorhini]|uniref:Uncharacterized protein n=1 Tax=Trypanosoma conorhini TaxID=83891 RepID=A0A3R7PYR5_9TRYP|nr:uncharacterized protein Tco025E_00474 [Trypanosoma conorhini]RNF27283.1 hypothetical protein Tco025E_00474 [Trypanosoma conorhini]